MQQPSSQYIHERQDEGNYVPQQSNFDVVSTGRMAKSEAEQGESGIDLLGRHLTKPVANSSGIFLLDDPYGLSSAGLNDSYQTYQENDNVGSFEPSSFLFKQVPTAGDIKAFGILANPVQTTRRTEIMNKVAVPSSGINVQEVRVVNPLFRASFA